jgi:flagellar protein FlaG
MGIQIAAAGMNASSQRELPQDRGSLWRYSQARIRAAEIKAAALENFIASLPGNLEPGEERLQDSLLTAAGSERITLSYNKRLEFDVDHQSHEVLVKVIDTETDKVIKVLPPEELQRLHRKIRETIGSLFDQRV